MPFKKRSADWINGSRAKIAAAATATTATVTTTIAKTKANEWHEKLIALNVYTRIYGCHAGALFSLCRELCSIIGTYSARIFIVTQHICLVGFSSNIAYFSTSSFSRWCVLWCGVVHCVYTYINPNALSLLPVQFLFCFFFPFGFYSLCKTTEKIFYTPSLLRVHHSLSRSLGLYVCLCVCITCCHISFVIHLSIPTAKPIQPQFDSECSFYARFPSPFYASKMLHSFHLHCFLLVSFTLA